MLQLWKKQFLTFELSTHRAVNCFQNARACDNGAIRWSRITHVRHAIQKDFMATTSDNWNQGCFLCDYWLKPLTDEGKTDLVVLSRQNGAYSLTCTLLVVVHRNRWWRSSALLPSVMGTEVAVESDPRLAGPGTVRAWEKTGTAGSISRRLSSFPGLLDLCAAPLLECVHSVSGEGSTSGPVMSAGLKLLGSNFCMAYAGLYVVFESLERPALLSLSRSELPKHQLLICTLSQPKAVSRPHDSAVKVVSYWCITNSSFGWRASSSSCEVS